MVMAQTKEEIIFEEDLPVEKIKSVSEEVFWGRNDPHWLEDSDEISNPLKGKHIGNSIDMKHDSYIWAFTGPRGAGKTEYMTYIAEKAAYLYDRRIISNYPIKLLLVYRKGGSKIIESEPLDLGKLLMFDADYQDVIICLDEAPQIINRLATMTWKNRLLDLWIQQIRKARASFLYAAQNENWVDNELRWQTDIMVKCRDFSRRYPAAGYKHGAMISVQMLDKSGQWTGYSYEERPRIVKQKRVLLEPIWGTFDTYHELDVFESLKKAELNVGKYKVGHPDEEVPDYGSMVFPVLEEIMGKKGKKRIKAKEFYQVCGIGGDDKRKVGMILGSLGAERNGIGNTMLDFSKLDMNRLRSKLQKYD